MTKIYNKEINDCSECPFFYVRETYSESIYYCAKEKELKKLDYSGTQMIMPEWCPLPDKEEEND